jgi:hypothetical protein
MSMPKIDPSILQAALIGYTAEAAKLQEKIDAIQMRLDGRRRKDARVIVHEVKAKRQMSAAGRRRIAAAQKARWKKFHANQGKPAKKAAAKRTMSPERKAALVANLAKARAARLRRSRLLKTIMSSSSERLSPNEFNVLAQLLVYWPLYRKNQWSRCY